MAEFDLIDPNVFGMNAGPQDVRPDYSLGTPQISAPGDLSKTGFGGMTPAQWGAILGQLGSAIGGNTTGGRIAQVAGALGETQLKAMMAQKTQKDQMAALQELLSKGVDLNNITPDQSKMLGITPNLLLGGEGAGLMGSGPSGTTGLETGKISPSKLNLLNTPSSY